MIRVEFKTYCMFAKLKFENKSEVFEAANEFRDGLEKALNEKLDIHVNEEEIICTDKMDQTVFKYIYIE